MNNRVLAGILALCLCGCLNRESNRERQQVRQVQWPALAIATPAGTITIPAGEARELITETEHEQAQTRLELPALPLPVPGGGLGGGLIGMLVAGGVAAWKTLQQRKAQQQAQAAQQQAQAAQQQAQETDDSFRTVVLGVERAKKVLDQEQVERLEGELSRSMDASHKAKVRKVKQA